MRAYLGVPLVTPDGLVVGTLSVMDPQPQHWDAEHVRILGDLADAIMTELHEHWPHYEFAQHKGYVTPGHAAALTEFGPCPEHRRRYVNVRRAMRPGFPVGDNDLIDDPIDNSASLSMEMA